MALYKFRIIIIIIININIPVSFSQLLHFYLALIVLKKRDMTNYLYA